MPPVSTAGVKKSMLTVRVCDIHGLLRIGIELRKERQPFSDRLKDCAKSHATHVIIERGFAAIIARSSPHPEQRKRRAHERVEAPSMRPLVQKVGEQAAAGDGAPTKPVDTLDELEIRDRHGIGGGINKTSSPLQVGHLAIPFRTASSAADGDSPS